MTDIAAVMQRTQDLLGQIFNEPTPPNDKGYWYFTYGTAGILVQVVERSEDEVPVVTVSSPILSDTEKSPQLLDYLNDMNANMHFAHAYWSNGYIWVSANLIGATLDREELEKAMNVVGKWSDELDEAFAQTFGGVLPFAPEEPPAGAWEPQQGAAGVPPPPSGAISSG